MREDEPVVLVGGVRSRCWMCEMLTDLDHDFGFCFGSTMTILRIWMKIKTTTKIPKKISISKYVKCCPVDRSPPAQFTSKRLLHEDWKKNTTIKINYQLMEFDKLILCSTIVSGDDGDEPAYSTRTKSIQIVSQQLTNRQNIFTKPIEHSHYGTKRRLPQCEAADLTSSTTTLSTYTSYPRIRIQTVNLDESKDSYKIDFEAIFLLGKIDRIVNDLYKYNIGNLKEEIIRREVRTMYWSRIQLLFTRSLTHCLRTTQLYCLRITVWWLSHTGMYIADIKINSNTIAR